ncbi:hypothetical protein J4H86_23430 [Spiractinospora alimapuensis]|uniref:hypothetical protein n=1 Tax=Spiractinospora alimapuensis TaxID=2820884 RepID=UPI001F248B8D|nr:hypothetical protein [Spiractinospora alimapuensis]QVQ51692.1 hypothetical protein J4H86_23430 [Spiractinospora alimapuensis]
MTEVLLAMAVAVVSALAPFVSIEVYLVGATAVTPEGALAAMAIGAGVMQPIGKLAYYSMGRILNVRWLKRKKPGRWAGRMARWREQAEDRPVWFAALMGASAFASVPPYLLMCVLAGTVRMNVVVFLAVSVPARIARFLIVVFVPHAAFTWFGL